LQPHDLIKSAKVLLECSSGKPSQVNLRRSISSIYYALFHCLARNSADLLIGGTGSDRSKPAWQQTYRALEHGVALNACKNGPIITKFPKAVEDFANHFVTMQDKRHQADYDPFAKFTKSETLADLTIAESVLADFKKVAIKDRRAFCAHVIFRKRKS
jgi:uncharacterized protein (UPF0332 family)